MDKLNVFADVEGVAYKIGRLAMDEEGLRFQHDPSLLESPVKFSPFHLDPAQGVLLTNPGALIEYDYLPGMMADSLGDSWGYQLRSGFLKQHATNPDHLNIIQHLAFLGNRSMGALRYEPEEPFAKYERNSVVSISRLAAEALAISQGKIENISSDLAVAGGIVGGTNPKIAVGLNVKTGQCIHGVDELPSGYDHYLIKFRPKLSTMDHGAAEYVYSLMAKASGIHVPDSRLLEVGTERFVATRRFDRVGHHKLHMHSFGHLLHATPKHRVSYDMLFGTTQRLTNNMSQVSEVFRRMSFNVAVHNKNDHPNNHAFLMNSKGHWSLAPAYDLNYSKGLGKHHQLHVTNKETASRDQLISIGNDHGISKANCRKILDQVSEGVSQWEGLAKRYELNSATVSNVGKSIESFHGKGMER